ncbi:hypothetical protein IAT38_001251 [Cryptococcus sp. DSM 104549]
MDKGKQAARGPVGGPPADKKYPYLASLNQAQLEAVTASPSTPLQILAGPGSGKTRVLTSRVAYLVQHHGYHPKEIVAVTFTNKTANEMRKRLQVLLGPQLADGLVLGTFHATCAKYLRRFGQLINLSNNFVIADADDCKKIITNLLKDRKDELAEASMTLKDGTVLSEISKAKAKAETPRGMAARAAKDKNMMTSTLRVIAQLYEEYEKALRENNSLDFDDLLLLGLRLFKEAPRVVADIKHILVDEFQDTNTTQYELLKCFAKAHMGVSVVGDPDQSIYGWRSAEVENLNKMTNDFPGVQAIHLEENYRSTGSILSAAHAVVTQDKTRIQKNLFTSHPQSTPVTLRVFGTPMIEASFIATEIKRLVAYSGGLLNWGDFAILLRYNALSRVIESALQKDSIPNRIVGGHKFFERMEVKDLLAYLQLADNPNFTPAFMRVVNVPRRSIGDKTLADIVSAAKAANVSPMQLCENMTDGDTVPPGIKPGTKKMLGVFVGVIRKLRRAAEKGTPVGDMIKLIIEHTGYENYLCSTQPDFDSRWENVKELISYSVIVAEEQTRQVAGDPGDEPGFMPANSATVEAMINRAQAQEQKKEKEEKRLHPMFQRTGSDSSRSQTPAGRSRSASAVPAQGEKGKAKGAAAKKGKDTSKVSGAAGGVIEVLDSDDDLDGVEALEAKPLPRVEEGGVEDEDDADLDSLFNELANAPQNMTPLAYFLQTSMLSTDTDSEQDDANAPKVTITTVHSAKGLEWPVVFIPAVEQGTYPSYRCTEPHEIAEERRLLYVAMTRAQSFLTMSHCQFRMMGGEEKDKEVSEFVGAVTRHHPDLLSANLPDVDINVRQHISKMLSRTAVSEEMTREVIMRHVRAAPPLSTWDPPQRGSWMKPNRFARRDVTKATRAAEYWASDADEYALPGSQAAGGAGARPGSQPQSQPYNTGFMSARTSAGLARPPGQPGQPRPPPPPVKSANTNMPAPLPFTFGEKDEGSKEAGLGTFMSGGDKSLAMMAGLGVMPGGPPAGTGPGAAGAGAGGAGGGAPTSRGTKRLGMGRPAPWGAKKPRDE